MASKVIYMQDSDGEGGYKMVAKVYYFETKNGNTELLPKTANRWDEVHMEVEVTDNSITGPNKEAYIEAIEQIVKDSVHLAPKDMPATIYMNVDGAYIDNGVIFKDKKAENLQSVVDIGWESKVFGSEKFPTILGPGVEIREYSRVSAGCEIGAGSVLHYSEIEPNTTLGESVELDNSHIGYHATVGRNSYLVNKRVPHYCDIPAFYHATEEEFPIGQIVVVKTSEGKKVGIITKIHGSGNMRTVSISIPEESIVNVQKSELVSTEVSNPNIPSFLKSLFDIGFYSQGEFVAKYILSKKP